ncbi:MAG: tRNA glutamyl-Q(34) synthetase GluQRS [Acidimicrobiales bacterium]
MATGRFAPSPTGRLHLGNLRTALVAWLFARHAGSRFVLRVEDLDPATSRLEHEAAQLADLAAIGLDWDGPVVRQSARRAAHDEAVAALERSGRTYFCFCTRREIQAAARAPHGPDGSYPGTCRHLSDAERRDRLREGRRPAVRLRADGAVVTVVDRIQGPCSLVVDDVVLRRNDGVCAYNLAVVVDDAHQGGEEVVRGDDLLESTPRQVHLARLLGLTPPGHAHVPLVLAPDGARLAKRHGAVTLADRAARGEHPLAVRSMLAASLGLCPAGERPSLGELLEAFDPERLPRSPWVWTDEPSRPTQG